MLSRAITVLILLPLCVSADEAANARAALALAMARHKMTAAVERKPAPTYEQQRALAIKTGKALIVGVGCTPPAGDWLTVEVPHPWRDFPKGIIVSYSRDNELWLIIILPPSATPSEIRAALARRRAFLTEANWSQGAFSSRGMNC